MGEVRFNPWLRAYHQRLLGAGKRPKVALVACMRKLLTAVLSVARSRRPFVPFGLNEAPPWPEGLDIQHGIFRSRGGMCY